MTYADLKDFIENRMRMSHVYQPVMLTELLRSAGAASETQIARAISGEDPSQVEYYEKVTRDMVGRVLRNHHIVERIRRNRTYRLEGFEELTEAEIETLVDACQTRLRDFLEKRGDDIWAHRRTGQREISGTLRYEVLKRARGRCELCGISNEERYLQVDHILPVNHGGSNDLTNLQALCYVCNASKRDRDDTDSRPIRESYEDRQPGCPFCDVGQLPQLGENPLAVAIKDRYPVTNGHTLVVPRRHVEDFFALGSAEQKACWILLSKAKVALHEQDSSILGFNVGVNQGEVAGQTVAHTHVHLVPRRKGDTAKPRGGVRWVVPEKADWRAEA